MTDKTSNSEKEDFRIETIKKLIEIEKSKKEDYTITLDYVKYLEERIKFFELGIQQTKQNIQQVLDEKIKKLELLEKGAKIQNREDLVNQYNRAIVYLYELKSKNG